MPVDKSLYDIIADLRPTWGRGPIQGHLGRFGFTGDEVLRSAGTLSGGERARVALAMLVLDHPHLLLLDEPTNHLDVESIEALEDALEGYDGTVILVSHDRELLRGVTTRTWVLEGGAHRRLSRRLRRVGSGDGRSRAARGGAEGAERQGRPRTRSGSATRRASRSTIAGRRSRALGRSSARWTRRRPRPTRRRHGWRS